LHKLETTDDLKNFYATLLTFTEAAQSFIDVDRNLALGLQAYGKKNIFQPDLVILKCWADTMILV